jgi:hypothetical protein
MMKDGVRDVAARGQYLCVLTSNQLAVHSRDFEELGSIHSEGCSYLAVSNTTAGVASGDHIHFFDLSSPSHPSKLISQQVQGVTGIESAQAAGSKNVFFLPKERGGTVVTLASRESVIELGTFEQTPWFSKSVRTGRIIAKVGDNDSDVRLYEIAKAATRVR